VKPRVDGGPSSAAGFSSEGKTMPIYTYRCDCGSNFDRLLPMSAEAPPCPDCGRGTRKIPSGFSLGGSAAVRPSSSPRSRANPSALWRDAFQGKPDKVRRELEFRQRLAAKDVTGASSSKSVEGNVNMVL
jgi:putative FmdB family regulatory protein